MFYEDNATFKRSNFSFFSNGICITRFFPGFLYSRVPLYMTGLQVPR